MLRPITFAFHGIARGELAAARAVSNAAGVSEHRVVRLPDLREASQIKGVRFPSLPPSYIPMRNAIFYSYAASYAEEVGADVIIGGHNRDDTSVFIDVSSKFFGTLERAFWEGSAVLSARKARIVRPLRQRTKPQVVRLGHRIGVPFELTWSCHRNGGRHCWNCEGCASRTLAFQWAGIADPLKDGWRSAKVS